MRYLAIAALLICSCTSKPVQTGASRKNSEAYQYALKKAFDDLNNSVKSRAPAADDPVFKFSERFQKTDRFEVTIYPKSMAVKVPTAPKKFEPKKLTEMKVVEQAPVAYSFRKDKKGACALGREMVPDKEMANCVQFEIRPAQVSGKRGQFIRLFLNPDFRVFGLSYHEYRPATDDFSAARSLLRWDPDEPLSSDTLPLSRDAAPIDLPIHASNGYQRTPETYKFVKGKHGKPTCDAYKFTYKNAFGSRVTAHWCVDDPWPTEVETSSYHAYLTKVL